MGKKQFILLAALLCSYTFATAQEDKKEKEAFRTNNWYIEVGGGAQLFFGRDASMLDFGKRLTPALSLTGGRWINPFWGARVQASGYALNGFSTAQGLYLGDPTGTSSIYGPNDPVRGEVAVRPDGTYRYYLRHLNLHADVQFSLANLIGGYDPYRAWDIIPAVGIGYMQTFAYKGTTAVSSISTNFSLMGKWKLPQGFDVNLEAFASLVPDRFDGRITDYNYESLFGLSVGVTYNFKGKQAGSARPSQVKQPKKTDWLAEVRQVVRDEIAASELERHTTDTVTIVKEVEKVVPAERDTLVLRIAALRFESGKTTPLRHQEVQLANIAEFAKANPDARFIIEGYADDETGSKDFNLQLSEKRAAAIKDLLIKDYELPADKLELKAYGSDVQVYDKSTWNRVVIVKAVK